MPIKWFSYLQRNSKTYWKEILAVLLLLIGIYFLRSQRHELVSIGQQLQTARPLWIWAGVLVSGLYILLQAAMYVSSFAAVGATLPLGQGIELFLKRNFLSVFLPAGGISSLAYAPTRLQKQGLGKLQTHQASAIYAFVGLFTVFIVGFPLLVFSLMQAGNVQQSLQGLAIVVLILGVMFYIFWSLRKKGKLYVFIQNKFPKLIPSVDEIFSANISNSQFWLTVIYSLGVEFCGIAHLFIAAKALNLPASFQASALAYIISVLLMIVSPFLRGLGAVELSMVYILSVFGYTAVNALAITILYRLFEFWLPLLAGFISFAWKGRYIFLRLFPALLVFALGVVNIVSVITPPVFSRLRLLREFIPTGSINASNLLVLLIGVILLITSAFLIRGQRNAWLLAMVFSVLSLLGHIFKALDYEEALLAASVLMVLALSSRQYRLKSDKKLIQVGFISVALVFLAVLLFGFIGYYFLDKRHFGFDFTWFQSLEYAAKNFLLIYNNELVPKTKFGLEFIHLMQVLGFIAWSFLAFVLLKPIFGRRRKIETVSPNEKAKAILHQYGESSVDYFKVNPDKLLFFSDRHDAFVAYRIANGFAIVLEEPVCAEEEKIAVLQEFDDHCHKMGLKTAFYRVDERSISYFSYLKKRKLLIGQEAVLDLSKFSLEGRDKKSLRNGLNSLQKKGYVTSVVKAPLNSTLLAELKWVSDEWLDYYGKKESVFSQGMFDAREIRNHDIIIIRDAEGSLKAFLNIIPDFAPGECTYDLIRKTADAQGGCMDALIIELIKYAKDAGLNYLNLGLVPMAGIEQPDNTAEQLIRYAYEKMKRFRQYTGLREFKEKYASFWLNKYLIYENDFDLLQLPGALNKVMQPVVTK
jgi:phosphatidylglycerol lysyltransferase